MRVGPTPGQLVRWIADVPAGGLPVMHRKAIVIATKAVAGDRGKGLGDK
jgi:hypothetical protein